LPLARDRKSERLTGGERESAKVSAMDGPYTLVIQADGWRTVEPKPSAQALKAFYAEAYFQSSQGAYAPDYSDQERAHRALLARQLLSGVGTARDAAPGRWLEVGCGEGWLLAAAKDAGWDVRGLDFSDEGLRRHHPALMDAVTIGDALDNLDALGKAGAAFEAMALEHVLEHVIDPEALMARLRSLVAPGGVIALTVPNDFSAVQTAAREANLIDRDFWVTPPQHLNYFDAPSLIAFLRRMDFEILGAWASFPIDWFLFHPGSNYVADPAAGKPAHRARMAIDLLLARQDFEAWLALGKALFDCGAGRSLTVVAVVREASR